MSLSISVVPHTRHDRNRRRQKEALRHLNGAHKKLVGPDDDMLADHVAQMRVIHTVGCLPPPPDGQAIRSVPSLGGRSTVSSGHVFPTSLIWVALHPTQPKPFVCASTLRLYFTFVIEEQRGQRDVLVAMDTLPAPLMYVLKWRKSLDTCAGVLVEGVPFTRTHSAGRTFAPR